MQNIIDKVVIHMRHKSSGEINNVVILPDEVDAYIFRAQLNESIGGARKVFQVFPLSRWLRYTRRPKDYGFLKEINACCPSVSDPQLLGPPYIRPDEVCIVDKGNNCDANMEKFLHVYSNISTTCDTTAAINLTKHFLYTHRFCAQFGYSLEGYSSFCDGTIEGDNVKKYIKILKDADEACDPLYLRSCIESFLAQKPDVSFLFLDVFSNVSFPLLDCVREVFGGARNGKVVADWTDGELYACDEAVVADREGEASLQKQNSFLEFKSSAQEAYWVAHKIKEIRDSTPHARIAVISDNAGIVQKIKAELTVLDVAYRVGPISLEQTTLGGRVCDRTKINELICQQNEGTDQQNEGSIQSSEGGQQSESDDNLDEGADQPNQGAGSQVEQKTEGAELLLPLSEFLRRHEQSLQNEGEHEKKILNDFFATVRKSAHILMEDGDAIDTNNICVGDRLISSEEYYLLISEIIGMYIIPQPDPESALSPGFVHAGDHELVPPLGSVGTNDHNFVAFIHPRSALAYEYDVAFLPCMNEGMWFAETKAPPMLTKGFYGMYDSPLEEAIFEYILRNFAGKNGKLAGKNGKLVGKSRNLVGGGDDCNFAGQNERLYITRTVGGNAHRFLMGMQPTSASVFSTQTVPSAKNVYSVQTVPSAVSSSIFGSHSSETSAYVPVSARPRALSIFDLQLLLDDPYAFYVRRILKVYPKPKVSDYRDLDVFANELLHQYFSDGAFEKDISLPDFAKQWYASCPLVSPAQAFNFLQKLRPALDDIYEYLLKERRTLLKISSKHKLKMTVPIQDMSFTIYGIADRVDFEFPGSPTCVLEGEAGMAPHVRGGAQGPNCDEAHGKSNDCGAPGPNVRDGAQGYPCIRIVDYKIGTLPSESSIKNLSSLQLPLKARMLFDSSPNIEIEVVQLTREPGRAHTLTMPVSQELMATVDNKVRSILTNYADESFVFARPSSRGNCSRL
ncbi:MAG: hypothetical protein LBQ43_00345 [Holosporales bacterium]|nr:hypothetical protein [Holosporales bacterium]